MSAVLDRPIEAEKTDKIRMSLDLSPEMKAVIDELAERERVTRADLLRRAIALLKAIKDAERRGESPALIDQEGHVTARLVGV